MNAEDTKLSQAINAIMEPGISDREIEARMQYAARLAGLGALVQRRAQESQHLRAVRTASANGDEMALRKLANANLNKRR